MIIFVGMWHTNRLRDRFELPADLLRLIEEMVGVYQQKKSVCYLSPSK